MPPQIALLLCIIFILFLFRIDYKRKSNISIALWIPLIWMMIIGSKMVSHWLYPESSYASADDYLEGSPLDRNVFIALIVAGLFILFKRKINWVQILKNNGFIFFYFLYCGISIVWSDFPFVALKRWIKDIGNLIMVLIVLTDSHPIEAVKTMIRRCAYVLIPLSIVLYKYYPSIGREYHRWSGELMVVGVTTQKNSLGVLCMVCGLYFLWSLFVILLKRNTSINKKEVFIHILLLVMILWLLKMANSATSLMCFITGVCILGVTRLPSVRKNVKHFGVYILCALFLFIILQYSLDLVAIIIQNLERDVTLTGRTDLWKELFAMGTNPLIGTGYDSFWLGHRMVQLWERWGWHPTEAHNGYIETYLELGLIGVFLLVGLIIVAYRKIKRELISDFEFGRFQLMFLILSLLYNYTESSFKGLQLMWFIFLLNAVKCKFFGGGSHHRSS